jgi:hypothetical protein
MVMSDSHDKLMFSRIYHWDTCLPLFYHIMPETLRGIMPETLRGIMPQTLAQN